MTNKVKLNAYNIFRIIIYYPYLRIKGYSHSISIWAIKIKY